MRKTVTKGLSALLALALALTLLCTGALAEGSATYPLFDEPVTITSVVVGKDMTHDSSRHCRMFVRQTALYIKVYCISWRYVGHSLIPLFR